MVSYSAKGINTFTVVNLPGLPGGSRISEISR